MLPAGQMGQQSFDGEAIQHWIYRVGKRRYNFSSNVWVKEIRWTFRAKRLEQDVSTLIL